MVVAQRKLAQRALSVFLLASLLLGTASAAAGGFLFKGKGGTYIKKESDICDQSAVPSFLRMTLRHRGGESKWRCKGGREGGMIE